MTDEGRASPRGTTPSEPSSVCEACGVTVPEGADVCDRHAMTPEKLIAAGKAAMRILAEPGPVSPGEEEPPARSVERERIACGRSHPDARQNADIDAFRESEGAPLDMSGCGAAGIWTYMYRCVECGRWFHRDCIRKHFAAHTSPGPVPGVPPHEPTDQPKCCVCGEELSAICVNEVCKYYLDGRAAPGQPDVPPQDAEGSLRQAVKEAKVTLIQKAREAARPLGYAIAVHGSLERDVDVIAVPWTEDAVPSKQLAEEIRRAIGGFWRHDEPLPWPKPHGREGWPIYADITGVRATVIDLSVLPLRGTPPAGSVRGLTPSEPYTDAAFDAADKKFRRYNEGRSDDECVDAMLTAAFEAHFGEVKQATAEVGGQPDVPPRHLGGLSERADMEFAAFLPDVAKSLAAAKHALQSAAMCCDSCHVSVSQSLRPYLRAALSPGEDRPPALVDELTDDQYVAALDAAYAAIEARAKECGAAEDQITLAQVLFSDGFRAALAAVSRGEPPAAQEET